MGADRQFRRFQSTGSPEALGRVFDSVAPKLLLAATHLAQLGADVTAFDIDPERLALVVENAERLGIQNLVCGEPEGESRGMNAQS